MWLVTTGTGEINISKASIQEFLCHELHVLMYRISLEARVKGGAYDSNCVYV